MRVGVVLDRWDPAKGGAERALADFVGAAIAAGHDVAVFAMSAAEGAPGRFVRVAVPPSPRGLRDIAFAKRAVAAARRECEVVLGVRHVTGVDVYWPHGGVHAETLAAVERSKGRALGAVSRTLHRVSPKQRALLALERRFFESDSEARIWCVSQMVKDEILSRWPAVAPRIEVHANGVDTDRFHPGLRDEHRDRVRRELRVPKDARMLLFFGGAWRLKGWPVLLRALTRIADGPWFCVAAGSRPDSAGRAVARAGLLDRVRVLDAQDPGPLLGSADLFVQPTWRDPCSLATLEALACGVPVVTTPANGAADAFCGHPSAGAVVAPGDADALAEAIRERGHPSQAARAAARSAALARNRATWLSGLVAALGSATSSR